MIEFMRRKVKFLIWAIVIAFGLSCFLMSASFLFWSTRPVPRKVVLDDRQEGESASEAPGASDIAARIHYGGMTEVVTRGELEREVERTLASSGLPRQFAPIFEAKVLERLVDAKLLRLAAMNAKIDVSAQLKDKVAELEAARRRMRSKAGMPSLPPLSKGEIREIEIQLKIQKMLSGEMRMRKVTDEQVRLYYKLHKDEFKDGQGKTLPLDKVRTRIIDILRSSIPEEEMKAFYERHKDELFRRPDTVDLRHLMFDRTRDRWRKLVKITEDELEAYYQEHKDEFKRPREFTVSYFMLPGDSESVPSADAATVTSVVIDEEELKRAYEQRKEEFVVTRESEEAEGSTTGLQYRPFEEVREELRDDLVSEKAEQAREACLEALRKRIASSDGGVRDDYETVFRRAAGNLKRCGARTGTVRNFVLGRNDGKIEGLDAIAVKGYVLLPIQRALADAADDFDGKPVLIGPLSTSMGDYLLVLTAVSPERYERLDECRDRVKEKLLAYRVGQELLYKCVRIARDVDEGKVKFEDVIRRESDSADAAFGGLWKQVVLEPGAQVPRRVEISAEGGKKRVYEIADEVLARCGSLYGLNGRIVDVLEGLPERKVSYPVIFGDTFHLFQIVRRYPPSYRPFEEVKDDIRTLMTTSYVSEREIRDYYDKHKDEFKSAPPVRGGEKIVFKHIMSPTLDKAKAVLEKALAGKESFDSLARKYSMDRNSAERGGEVERMGVPRFMRGDVDSMKPGEVYPKILRSVAGYHVVMLVSREKVEPAARKVRKLEDVRDLIRSRLASMKYAAAFEALVKRLKRRAVIERWENRDNPLPPLDSLRCGAGASSGGGAAAAGKGASNEKK